MESTLWSQEMGYRANRGPLGIYYLPTRKEEPFCGKVKHACETCRVYYLSICPFFFLLGQPLRASVTISEKTPKTSGMLFLQIVERDSTTNFKFRCK